MDKLSQSMSLAWSECVVISISDEENGSTSSTEQKDQNKNENFSGAL